MAQLSLPALQAMPLARTLVEQQAPTQRASMAQLSLTALRAAHLMRAPVTQ
jgi:hypothetical protein